MNPFKLFKKEKIKQHSFAGFEFNQDKEYEYFSEKVDFIYQNAELYLENTYAVANGLKTKTNILLGFIFSIISLCTYILNVKNSALFAAILVAFILLAVYVFLCCFSPKAKGVSGIEPDPLLTDNYLSKPLHMIKIDCLKHYQGLINNNVEVTEKIARHMKISIRLIIGIFFVATICLISPFSYI